MWKAAKTALRLAFYNDAAVTESTRGCLHLCLFSTVSQLGFACKQLGPGAGKLRPSATWPADMFERPRRLPEKAEIVQQTVPERRLSLLPCTPGKR